jgi:hypothetical protein
MGLIRLKSLFAGGWVLAERAETLSLCSGRETEKLTGGFDKDFNKNSIPLYK